MANEASVSFTTLLASAVHDMKNSLAVILNTIDELSEQQNPDPRRLKQLRHEGQRLNNEFIQLLALYRIENGQYFANIDDTSIAELLEEVQLENHATLAVRNIELSVTCEPELMWFCDRALLLGALNTIINNAYKFARRRIQVGAAVSGHMLILNVDDDGPGYPQELLSADTRQPRQIDFHSGSTGLGLHFSSVIAQLHHNKGRHGQIALSNTGIDGGGRFTLCLP